MNKKPTSRTALQRTANKNQTNQEDVKLALEFVDYYSTVENLAEGSINKYYYAIKAFLIKIHELGTSITELDEKDTIEIIKFLQQSEWSEDTRADYWDRFTRFYEWSADRAEENGNPYDKKAYRLLADAKHKKTYKINDNRKTKKGILNQNEILTLIDAETNLCYKAFFATLYESGMRSGEALSLLIRDVEKNENGTYAVRIRRSKTIKRPIPLFGSSVNYLRKWLSQHPQKDDKDAPLFLNTIGERLKNPTANKELRQLLEVTGIDTPKVTLHSFRHSRATHLAAKGLTEYELCKLFGWKMTSKMPATYIREGALDVTKAVRRAQGLPVEDDEQHQIGVRCLQCDHRNAEEADYCDNCNLPLDEKKLQIVKDNARAVRERELTKEYAKTMRKDILDELRVELGIQ